MAGKKCEICGLSLFTYNIKHNGRPEVIERCMTPHGRSADNEKLYLRYNFKYAYGPEEQFRALFEQPDDEP